MTSKKQIERRGTKRKIFKLQQEIILLQTIHLIKILFKLVEHFTFHQHLSLKIFHLK